MRVGGGTDKAAVRDEMRVRGRGVRGRGVEKAATASP